MPQTAKRELALVRINPTTAHALGIIVLDKNLNERVVILIPADTPVPCQRRARFAYAYDNMTAARVEVTHGIGLSRNEVTVVGEVILENLPPRTRGTPIDVIFRYNVNQILEVEVIDVETTVTCRARMYL